MEYISQEGHNLDGNVGCLAVRFWLRVLETTLCPYHHHLPLRHLPFVMVNSPIATTASVVAFGTGAVPGLSRWTPASVYLACQAVLKSFILISPVTLFINAPFGRFSLPGSLFKLPGRAAFALMELPAPVFFALAMATPEPLSHDVQTKGANLLSTLINPSLSHLKQLPVANLILGLLFLVHYTHRSIIQPVLGPPRNPSHLAVMLSASIFSVVNGFTMGAWIGGRSPALLVPASLLSSKAALESVRAASWFAGILPRSKAASPGLEASSILPVAQPGLLPAGVATLFHPLFILGILGWAIGFASNVYHDEILFDLRRPDKRGGGPAEGTRTNVHKSSSNGASQQKSEGPRYEIPQGGLFSLISYPNYFSECECE